MILLQMFIGFVFFTLIFATVFGIWFILKERRDAIPTEDADDVTQGTPKVQ